MISDINLSFFHFNFTSSIFRH